MSDLRTDLIGPDDPRWTAVLALCGYLFAVGGAFPSWGAATYSPWIYPVNFAQTFFYVLILRLALLRGQPLSVRWALLTGALCGLTFLAHTAPTLLFAGVLLLAVIVPAPTLTFEPISQSPI